MHFHLGGCPAVLLPHQRDPREGPHMWDCLQHIVTYVDLPMWLPGKCFKSSHIMMIILQHKMRPAQWQDQRKSSRTLSMAKSG